MLGNRTIGPYSDVMKVGNLFFLSGRIGLDYSTMQLVESGIAEQTCQFGEVLEMAGSALDNVVKATVFLTNMSDFTTMNTVYGEAFADRKPARSTVAVAGLPMQALVEIDVIVAL